MNQLRSRFRLITLLLACAFLLTLVLCTANVLKAAGVTLSSLSSLPFIGGSPSPGPSVSPDSSPDTVLTPGPAVTIPSGNIFPETDNTPDPEYNVEGL